MKYLNVDNTSVYDAMKYLNVDNTAGSYYKLILSLGMTRWPYDEVWNSCTPSKVRIFAYPLLQDKLLTHEVMAKLYLHCEMRCVLCESSDHETAHHLFFSCTYASQVWCYIERLGYNLVVHGETVEETWCKSRG